MLRDSCNSFSFLKNLCNFVEKILLNKFAADRKPSSASKSEHNCGYCDFATKANKFFVDIYG